MDEKVRLDKWLWAARFFRTRSLAREAIDGGKIHCQAIRCKPSREVRVGDQLEIRRGDDTMTVTIKAITALRQGAPLASQLYEETAQSCESRERIAAQRKAGGSGLLSEGRPNKKQRRQIRQALDAIYGNP